MIDRKSTKVGKDGAVLLPAALRRRFGMKEGSPVVAEARQCPAPRNLIHRL